MPEIKNTFVRGRMNKDLDERLLPDGEYRDATNIQISSTESDDAGTVQNILGNIYANDDLVKSFTGDGSTKIFELTFNPLPSAESDFKVYIDKVLQVDSVYAYNNVSGNLTFTTAPGSNLEIKIEFIQTYGLGGSCVGIFPNEETNKIYLFIKGDSINAIIEYDSVNKSSIPVLVDARSTKILDFSDTKITGVCILQDYLIWTDNSSEPKIIDISEDSIFKKGSLINTGVAYNRTTQIKHFSLNSDGTVRDGDGLLRKEDFKESDITLIRKKPNNAPKFIIETNATAAATNVIPDPPGNRIHQEKFIRFAYRWKYINGQYSALSPFTEALFLPNITNDYDLEDGYNNQMVNNITDAKLVNIEYGSGQNTINGLSDIISNIEFIDIIYKESNNNNLYLYKTLTRKKAEDVFYTGISVNGESKKGVIPPNQLLRHYDNVPYRAKAVDTVANRLVFGNYTDGLDLEGFSPEFNITTEYKLGINATEQKNYLSKTATGTIPVNGYASLADGVKDTTTIKSGRSYQIGIVFEDEYGRQSPVVTSDSGFHKEEFETGEVGATGYGKRFSITMDKHPPGFIEFTGATDRKLFSFPEDPNYPMLNFPKSINDFTVTINGVLKTAVTHYNYDSDIGLLSFGTAPTAGEKIIINASRIKRFKYFIKESNSEYYNIIVENIFDDTEEDVYWLAVPSYEINKVNEYDYLLLKKKLYGNTSIDYEGNPENFKYKVLDIKEEIPPTADTKNQWNGYFFVKLKRDQQLTDNLFNQRGSGGKTGVIKDDSKNWKEVKERPKNSLFLGSYWEEQSDREGDGSSVVKSTKYAYYYTSGTIQYTERPHSYATSPTANDRSVFEAEIAADSITSHCSITLDTDDGYPNQQWIDLTNLSSKDTTDAGDISDASPWEDTSGTTINSIAVQVDSRKKPIAFHICNKATEATTDHDENGGPAIFETIPKEDLELDFYYETSESFPISQYGKSRTLASEELQTQKLAFYNAFIMGNGLECNRIKDDYNEHILKNGVKVSTTINQEFTERNQKTSLIYSGIFNSENNVNKLNEFNVGEKITKELNPDYGSIQKLYSRNTDIIALCEDKILNIVANKDALYNADGNINLTSTNQVLGQAIAYNGEYGISKNPESFASSGYTAYFTDKSRGVVLRLSGMKRGVGHGQGVLDIISSKGMIAYFREHLSNETSDIIGSYDVYADQYILSVNNIASSIAFKENVDGWVSKLTFLPDSGTSVNGNYYTCKSGELYKHHSKNVKRNNFYGLQYTSGVKLIFNQEPSIIKNFKTISYEGTEGWLSQLNGIDVILTDQQKGEVKSFIKKEGKYLSYISGVEDDLETIFGDELDSKLKSFSIQGLGNITSHGGLPTVATTTTLNTFTCSDAVYAVADGVLASAVSASVTKGTLVSTSPSLYKEGTVTYTGTITVPTGYTNTGENITCTAQATIAEYNPAALGGGDTTEENNAVGDCSFTLAAGAHNGTLSELTGTFGSNYSNTDSITLEAPAGITLTISLDSSAPIQTTKQALAAGLDVTVTDGTKVKATVTTGTCTGHMASVTVPNASANTILIAGDSPKTAFCNETIRLQTTTTATSPTYQWYKGTSSSFTLNAASAIANATLSYYDASESAADQIYYKVKINGSTDSNEHDITWTCLTQFANLRFKAGDEILLAACSASGTLRTIYGNNSTFASVTQFSIDGQGTTTGLEKGTYSNSDNNTNYHHVFIDDDGVPGAFAACNVTTGNAINIITASACRNSSKTQNFRVTKATSVADLVADKVINFSSTYDNEPYWVVEGDYTGTNYVDVTLSTVASANTCITQDPPTIDMVGAVEAFTSNNFDITATLSHTAQGGTYSYQFTRATSSGGTYSDLGSAQPGTTKTTSEGTGSDSGVSYFYKAVLNGSINTSNFLTVVIKNRPAYTGIKLTTGSSIATRETACKQSTTTTLYGDQSGGLQFARQLYSANTGATASNIADGTYSDGVYYAFVDDPDGDGEVIETTVTNDQFGTVTSYWHSCGDLEANATFLIKDGDCTSGTTTTSPNPNVTQGRTLYACPVNFTPTNYVWTRTPAGGSSAPVQTGIQSTYFAQETTALAYTYGCTASGPDSEGVNVSLADNHAITFVAAQQDMTVQACPAGSSYNIRITNGEDYVNGNVIKLAAVSGFSAGCYKVTNASYSGSLDYTTTLTELQYYSTCCNCTACSVTIGMTLAGASSTETAIETGSVVVLTAAAVGYTASSYEWKISTDGGVNYGVDPVSTNAVYSTTSTPALINTDPHTRVYKCTVAGTAGESEYTTKTIAWYHPTATRQYFNLQQCDDDNVQPGAKVTNDALAQIGSFVSLTDSDLCFQIVSVGSGDVNTPLIDETYSSCDNCNTDKNPTFCNFTIYHNNIYPNPTFNMTGGSSILSTDTIRLTVSGGTIGGQAYKDVTRAVLSNGHQESINEGVTVTGTITTGTCVNTTATVVAPLSACTAVQLYKAHSNPAGDTTSALLLCGDIGGTKTVYLNKPTLAEATAVYTDPDCSISAPFNTYLSTGNGQYYVWNAVTLNGPYTLNCP